MHGAMQIAGFRFGNAAYMTDVSAIPESSFALLEGLEVLVLSALRHKPHPSHATLEQALAWASASARAKHGSRTLPTISATKKPTAHCLQTPGWLMTG